MRTVRRKTRILAFPVAIVALGSLCACGMLGIGKKALTQVAPVAPVASAAPGVEHVVVVHVQAAANANPSAEGEPRPVRVCAIAVERSGWRPPHGEERRPCTGVEKHDDVVAFDSGVIAPGTSHDFRIVLPARKDRALLVAAEFQQGNDAVPWIDIDLMAGDHADVAVAVRGGALVLLSVRPAAAVPTDGESSHTELP